MSMNHEETLMSSISQEQRSKDEQKEDARKERKRSSERRRKKKGTFAIWFRLHVDILHRTLVFFCEPWADLLHYSDSTSWQNCNQGHHDERGRTWSKVFFLLSLLSVLFHAPDQLSDVELSHEPSSICFVSRSVLLLSSSTMVNSKVYDITHTCTFPSWCWAQGHHPMSDFSFFPSLSHCPIPLPILSCFSDSELGDTTGQVTIEKEKMHRAA